MTDTKILQKETSAEMAGKSQNKYKDRMWRSKMD
jgi:hypothetical protein